MATRLDEVRQVLAMFVRRIRYDDYAHDPYR